MGWGAKRVGRGEARVRKGGGGKGGVESEWTGLHASLPMSSQMSHCHALQLS